MKGVDFMNLYWSVYENLEAEVLSLADSIMFDNDQLGVYSLKIGDLIVRCAVEIESISKELYLQEGGQFPVFDKNGEKHDLYFDTDCLDLLVKKWNINKKKLHVSSLKMDFSSSNLILTPLEKSNQRGKCQWKKAYQAIKHNRAISLKQANIKNLLNALGALYILNLYYRNDSFWCNIPIYDKIPYMNLSKIFTPYICDITSDITLLLSHRNTSKELLLMQKMNESVYVKKYTDESIKEKRKIILRLVESLKMSNMSLLDWTNAMTPVFSKNSVQELVGNPELLKWISNFNNLSLSEKKIIQQVNVIAKEIVLNKNLSIFPEESFEEFLKAEN